MRGPLIEAPRPARPWHRRRRTWQTAAATVVLVLIASSTALFHDVRTDTTTDPTIRVVPAAPTATPPASTPTATPAPAPAVVAFDPPRVGRGETTLITVRRAGADSASVWFLGRHYPLMRHGDLFWAPLGAGLVAPLGDQVAQVTLRDALGEPVEVVDVPFEVVTVDRPVDFLVLTEEQGAVLTPEAAATEARLRTFEQFNIFDGRFNWNGRFVMPAEGFITTEFGQARSINGGPIGAPHSGLDIANAQGTPIVAPAPGRVTWAGPMPIRGNTVLLDHGAGVVTGYHHLLEATVEVGDIVQTGDEIALMGSTGLSTGPHLHWEMTIYGVNVDPVTWTERTFMPAAR